MKDYNVWMTKKRELEGRTELPNFTERDIWWCSIGENVGYEEDGKNKNYERPVCVLRKFNRHIFIGLPLTSTAKEHPYYFPHTLHETNGAILLSQGRILSAKRLQRRLGRISRGKFLEIKRAFLKLYE